jgi:hypothetical protein
MFWTRIFNATSFPDLREAVIIHERVATSSYWVDEVRFGPDDLKGLGQVTSLVVDSAPELNDAVLQGALTRAQSLKRLELKNIHGLSYDGMLTSFCIGTSLDLAYFVVYRVVDAPSARTTELGTFYAAYPLSTPLCHSLQEPA